MSRIGKLPVAVPAGVEVSIKDGSVNVKGSGGVLSLAASDLVVVQSKGGFVSVVPANDSREANSMSGTMRQMIGNMVTGVSKGFEKKLMLVGVGFRAQAQGQKLNLQIGYSHPVEFVMPEGVTVATPAPTEIILKGADRQRIGQVAANIRAARPPEPYKGKGIRYADEKVVIKEAKKK